MRPVTTTSGGHPHLEHPVAVAVGHPVPVTVIPSTTDLVLLFGLGGLGVLGWVMRRFGSPNAPAIISLILGPIAEEQLRRTLTISQGDLTALVSSPFTIVAYACIAVFLAAGIWIKCREARTEAELSATAAGTPARRSNPRHWP